MQNEKDFEKTEEKHTIKEKGEKILKKIQKKATAALVCIAVLFLVGGISYLSGRAAQKKQAELEEAKKMQMIDEHFISGKLEDMSELTTQKLSYSGVIEVTDGSIPYITQKGFLMTYTAKIRAGIDLSRATVKCGTNAIVITLPSAEIQSIDISPESIEFHAEKKALFNWSQNEDVTQALSLAQEDVEQKGDIGELLEQANDNARAIVTTLLEGIDDDRTIEVNINQDTVQ